MIARLAGVILPVFLIIAIGYIYARRVKPDMTQVNRLSMTIFAPALVVAALASKEFDLRSNSLLLVAALGVILGSGLLAWPLARAIREDPRTFVPPAMFNNNGNLGLPFAALAFGQSGFYAMVGIMTVSNLVQFTLGQWIIDRRAPIGKVLRSPILWSTLVGFALASTHPPLPEWLMTGIRILGDAMVPLMLISLGARLAEVEGHAWKIGIIGGITCPVTGLIMAAVLGPLLHLDPTQQGLLLLFGCLPPAVLNFLVAEQFRQEPDKVASIVLIGNVLAVVFVPIGITLALH